VTGVGLKRPTRTAFYVVLIVFARLQRLDLREFGIYEGPAWYPAIVVVPPLVCTLLFVVAIWSRRPPNRSA